MKILTRIIYLVCFIVLLVQCKKDHSVLNTAVQPAGDLLKADFNGTAPVYAHTVKYDSIAIADDRYRFLGSNQDPVFGRMDVGLYLNANMTSTYLNFGSDAHFTSSEIILNVIDNMGDKNTALTYSVFAVDSDLDPNIIYYSNNTRLHNSKSLISVYTGSYTTMYGKAVLRIPINNDYAKAIFYNPDYLINNSVFQKTYKGFYIATSLNSGDGIIYKCNLDDDISGFYLRYQVGTTSATKEDKSFRFTFAGVTAARFNTTKFNFNDNGNINLVQQVVNGDTSAGSTNLFLKGLGATKLKVYIPSLKSYVDSAFTIAVNRAEMAFNVDPAFMNTDNPRYVLPPRLSLLPMDNLSKETYAPDQNNSYRYNGNLDTSDAAHPRYVFNISRFAQQVIKGQRKNYGFYLVVANTDIVYGNIYDGDKTKELIAVRRDNYMERVVLAGSGNSSLKPQFNLSYIKLKKE